MATHQTVGRNMAHHAPLLSPSPVVFQEQVARPALAEAAPHRWMKNFLGVTRLSLGGIFLWAFLDKLLGLGFSTPAARSVLQGGSPTKGYLSSSYGPLSGLFQGIAGNVATDVLFMAGLAGVGLALLLGTGIRVAGVSGAAMMLFMFLSHPPWAANPHGPNPLLDDHVVYGAILLAFAFSHAGRYLGLGGWWERQPVVKKNPWLA